MGIFKKRIVQVGIVLIALSLFTVNAFGSITSVSRLGTSANCVPTIDGPLVDGSGAYCDRTEPLYTYTGIPQGLIDVVPDYVIVAVEDRDLADYGLDVTVNFPGLMLLFIEDGLDVANGMPWVASDGYTDSGLDLTLDKAAEFPDVPMNIFVRIVDAATVGTITTGPQNIGGSASIYGVAFQTFSADLEAAAELPDSILAGTQITVNASVNNLGTDQATGVLMDVTIPAGMTYVSDTGGCSPIGPTLYQCDLGQLNAAASGSVDFVLDVALDATDSTLVVAAISDMMDPNINNNSADVPVTITQASDLVTSFATSIEFPNGDTDAVTATLSCNAGLPLEQSAEISTGSLITFVVTNLPFTTPGTSCEVTIDGLDSAYTYQGSANDGAAADSCLYEVGTFADSGENTCVFTATPVPFNFWANVIWTANSDDGSDIPVSGDLSLSCTNVWDGTSLVTVSDLYAITAAGTYQLVAGTYSPDPDGDTVCNAALVVDDNSAVEVDNSACTDIEVEVGDPYFLLDEEGEPIENLGEVILCDIEATAFFEGIPTLSQYGMAIMVLLMLGVGFVGMRRFV